MSRNQLLQYTLIGLLITGLAACVTTPTKQPEPAQAEAENAEDLMIVDCLLPGQVRKLGAQASYLTSRRPIKTTAVDCEIRGGEYVSFDRADYATALKVWLPQAQAGDPAAQNYVGEIYEKGLGLLPDYAVAAHWYHQAADQGYARAQINIGHLYEKGLGVDRDMSLALNWYRKASGLNTDTLEYSSSVAAAHETEAQLQKMKDKHALQKRETERLKVELADAKGEIERQKSELNQSKSQLDNVAVQLLAAKNRVFDPSVSIEVQRREVEELQKLLEHERARHDRELKTFAEETLAIGDRRKLVIEALEEELRQQRQEVALQSNKIKELEDRAYSLQSSEMQLAALDTTLVDPPMIEIIEPPMTLTRGRPTYKLRSATRNQEIIGKVEAAAGLAAFKVNNRVQEVDKYSLFWVDVPIYKKDTPIEIVAVDNKGRRVTVDFSFITDRVIAQQPVVEKPDSVEVTNDLGKYYALVIGNNNYAHFPKLDTAVNDAKATATLLREKYGYETTTIIDADRYALLSAFNSLREKLTDKDNLLVYYAGHGELDRVNERGYWLPVDAEPGNTANWISNVAISDIINAMPAKHVMVVADSCYAGTMSSASMARLDLNLPADVKSEWVSIMSETRARTVLTSGGIAPVLDGGGGQHSVFAQAFLNVLGNADGLMEGHSLFRQVLSEVKRASKALNQEQIPDYAPIKHAGHEAGEYFFMPLSS